VTLVNRSKHLTRTADQNNGLHHEHPEHVRGVAQLGPDRVRHPARVARPRDLDELVATVRDSHGLHVRAVGAGHSFTGSAVTDGVQVHLDALSRIERVRPRPGGTAHVTVGAGTRLADLNVALAERGLAMRNLGDIDRQNVAGAISTGTHGTATITTAMPLGKTVRDVNPAADPSRLNDPVWLFTLEVSLAGEAPFPAVFGHRVPLAKLGAVAPGVKLAVAVNEANKNQEVAIDWEKSPIA